MVVDDARPSIDRHHRHDALVFIRERENLAREGIQAVLVGHHEERGHLLVRHLARLLLEGGRLQDRQELL
jgi:hypothetical protein